MLLIYTTILRPSYSECMMNGHCTVLRRTVRRSYIITVIEDDWWHIISPPRYYYHYPASYVRYVNSDIDNDEFFSSIWTGSLSFSGNSGIFDQFVFSGDAYQRRISQVLKSASCFVFFIFGRQYQRKPAFSSQRPENSTIPYCENWKM